MSMTRPRTERHECDHEWVRGWQKCEPSYRWSESQQWPDDVAMTGCRKCHVVWSPEAARTSGRVSMVEGVGRNRHVLVRYRLEHGELVPRIDGQWTHVQFCGVKTWVLDEPQKLGAPHP